LIIKDLRAVLPEARPVLVLRIWLRSASEPNGSRRERRSFFIKFGSFSVYDSLHTGTIVYWIY